MIEPTARDLVFYELVESEEIRWTTLDMVDACNGCVSQYTVRNTFNALTELGLMNHKNGSQYWYWRPAL